MWTFTGAQKSTMHKVEMRDTSALQVELVSRNPFYNSIRDTTKNKSSNRPKTFHIVADLRESACGVQNTSSLVQSVCHCCQLGSVHVYIFKPFEPFLALNFESKHFRRRPRMLVWRIHWGAQQFWGIVKKFDIFLAHQFWWLSFWFKDTCAWHQLWRGDVMTYRIDSQ